MFTSRLAKSVTVVLTLGITLCVTFGLTSGCLDFDHFSSGGGSDGSAVIDAFHDARASVDLSLSDLAIDADQDGYTLGQGDCDDGNPLVNPGAFDIPGNQIDDDCNGLVDDPPAPCDQSGVASDATAFAGAIDLCKPWLVDAAWNPGSDNRARFIRTGFGTGYKPQLNSRFGMISTGIAGDEKEPDFVAPQPGTPFTGMDQNPAAEKVLKSPCNGQLTPLPALVLDLVALTVHIKVPTNARALGFSWGFFTADYPEYIGNTSFDLFEAILDSKAFKGNVAIDGNGLPPTVNSLLLTACKPAQGCMPHSCPAGLGPLAGTGYEMTLQGGEPMGAGSAWLLTTVPVTPRETITLTFFVYDAGDHYWDSAALLDGFHWLAAAPSCGGGPCAAQ